MKTDAELNLRRQNLHTHLSAASANSLEVCLQFQGHRVCGGFTVVSLLLFKSLSDFLYLGIIPIK